MKSCRRSGARTPPRLPPGASAAGRCHPRERQSWVEGCQHSAAQTHLRSPQKPPQKKSERSNFTEGHVPRARLFFCLNVANSLHASPRRPLPPLGFPTLVEWGSTTWPQRARFPRTSHALHWSLCCDVPPPLEEGRWGVSFFLCRLPAKSRAACSYTQGPHTSCGKYQW